MSDEQKADPIRKPAAIALMAIGAVMLLVNVIAARSMKDSGAMSGASLILLGLVLYRGRTSAVKKP
jgi:hypothetical protein